MPYIKLEDLNSKEIVKGYKAKFVHSDNMTTAYWEVDSGAVLPVHSHKHEQISNIIKGEFEFDLDGEVRIIKEGDVIVIPSNVPHGGKAVSECKIIDTFSPVREDYKLKT